MIGFAVGVDVTREFKEAAARVAGDEWRELEREDGGGPAKTGQEYAEVNFVPNWIGHSKNSPTGSSPSGNPSGTRPCRGWRAS